MWQSVSEETMRAESLKIEKAGIGVPNACLLYLMELLHAAIFVIINAASASI